LDANGTGKVTALATGYGASMHDASKWEPLDERTITLANLTGVDMAAAADGRIEHTPDYIGVEYTGTGSSQGVVGSDEGTATGQAERTALNSAYWGSFPSDFVDFQNDTGQFSYWFTSNGARDPYKVALPVTITFDGAGPPALG